MAVRLRAFDFAIAVLMVTSYIADIVLKDAKDVDKPGAPTKESWTIQASNILSFQVVPVNNGQDSEYFLTIADQSFSVTILLAFRTDADITRSVQPKRERELQAWQPDTSTDVHVNLSGSNGATARGDDVTFGTIGPGRNWDQFAENERLFGVKTQFDEDVYTTKLDRSGKDFREREKRAERIAAEITGVSTFCSSFPVIEIITTSNGFVNKILRHLLEIQSATSNPHVAEERNMTVDDSGVDEEDK